MQFNENHNETDIAEKIDVFRDTETKRLVDIYAYDINQRMDVSADHVTMRICLTADLNSLSSMVRLKVWCL